MIFHEGLPLRLLVLVLLWLKYDLTYVAGGVRCIEREREALLTFKNALIDDYSILSSWSIKDDRKECCKWKGVVCSNTTGHVTGLNLRSDRSRDSSYLGGKISSALLELRHLKDLDIGGNDFGGDRIPEFICSMKQLQHLNLNESSFSGIVPPQLGNLTNLRTLDLSSNSLRFENLNFLSSLSFLNLLDLSDSDLSHVTDWLQQILKLHSLQELYLRNSSIRDAIRPSADHPFANSSSPSLTILHLSQNELTSSTFDWLFNISSPLAKLDLSFNQLDGPIPSPFGELINLEFLGLSFNVFGHKIPNSLGNLSRLQSLVLSNNQLTGPVPESLGQLSNLQYFDVSFNSLEGTITEANFIKLDNLYWLDLSINPNLRMNISLIWNPPFQLDYLSLEGCNIGPRFPAWIQTQTELTWLDLSGARISGQLPEWLTGLFSSPAVEYLNLSYNQISGNLPDFSSKLISIIDLQSNMLQGPLPLFHSSTWFCQLSHNMFSGSISSICTVSYSKLELLDLSNNQLFWDLPDCWEKMKALQVLSLANNNFSGEIPLGFGALSDLRSLHLHNNSFSGELPWSLKNCRFLELFDVGENEVTGNVPAWIGGNYRYMTHLSLRRNRLHGSIPQEICSLVQIQMLDISRNNLSGKIPECFNNFSLLSDKNGISAEKSLHNFIIDYALVQWKGQELKHYGKNLRLLKLIDLSSNGLVGDIPAAFSSLKGLISLNLSRNGLTGKLISDIGKMEMLEILDLSRNQLSGEIPIGLAQLHYLDVLDLANNNLSGKIPLSTQLQSFTASAYSGNNHLCGIPLALCPGDGVVPSISGQGEHVKEKDDGSSISLSYMTGFCISMAFGFIVGFWGVVASLVVKRSWRIAYFNLLDTLWNWLYVTTILCLAKFRRS